jgi:LacI family transcriptional regulator
MSISQIAFLRYKGCEKAFYEHGMLFEPERQYVSGYFTMNDGYHAMGVLLNKMPEVTAVFAVSDVMAIGAIRAIQDRGLRVPEDISVIGFDGIDIGKYTMPRLTTIRQHREEMAIRGVEILLNSLNEEVSAVHEKEPFYLIPGESVRKL